MVNWWNGKMTKRLIDKMASWHNGIYPTWQIDKMANWQTTNWRNGIVDMANDKMVN